METPARFVARYGDKTLTGAKLSDVGDVLAAQGFQMTQAYHVNERTLCIPHGDGRRKPAYIEHTPAPPPPVVPPPLDLTRAMQAWVDVAAGIRTPVPLTCRECGAVHPEGAVCTRPIYFEVKCCHETIYTHQGPHEAVNKEGRITHRWVEERVITDLPYNAYGPDGYDLDGC